MKDKFIQFLKIFLFFAFGFTILYLVYAKQNAAYLEQCAMDGIPAEECSLLLKIWTDFTEANYLWLVLTCLAFMITNVFRAIRWNLLFKPLGYEPKVSNSFWAVMIGYFANLGLPRLGEVLRPGTLARYEKIPVEKALGTVVVERVIDFLCLILFTVLALSLEFDKFITYFKPYFVSENPTEKGGFPIGWIIFILVLIGSIVLITYLNRRKKDHPIIVRIRKIIQGFWEGMKSVASVNKPWQFLLFTIGIWLLYFAMNWLAFMSFDATSHLGFRAALIVFIFGSLGIVIPSPGGMGTFHFLVTEALLIYGVSGEDGFSWANLVFFTIQIFCNVGFGLLALLFLPIINRDYTPQHPKSLQTHAD